MEYNIINKMLKDIVRTNHKYSALETLILVINEEDPEFYLFILKLKKFEIELKGQISICGKIIFPDIKCHFNNKDHYTELFWKLANIHITKYMMLKYPDEYERLKLL